MGRPTIQEILKALDNEVAELHRQFGGLPANVDADNIWKNIWLEETHHSTALEGNTLTPREVYYLVEQHRPRGTKDIRYYLEVGGYSEAARWVYEEAAAAYAGRGHSFSVSHVRQIHAVLMRPLWSQFPPLTGDRPGDYRHTSVRISGAPVQPPPAGDVAGLMEKWVVDVSAGFGEEHPVAWAAIKHCQFEQIHPFVDGNGRAGRLLMNYLLISWGYPPAIILKSQREHYLAALERAQLRASYQGMIELVARAVRDNLDRLLLPYMAHDVDLVPLATLSKESRYRASYLRRLAQTGKLMANRQGSVWFSSREWLKEYLDSRSSRGRKLK